MKPVSVRAFSWLQLASLLLAWLLQPAAASAQPAAEPAPPAWLQSKIDGYKRLPPFSPPRSITMTSHAGKITYYVSSACCDIPSELYDADGRLICHPDGGFAGGDGQCPGFLPGRQATVTVWRDERSAAGVPKR